VLNLWRKTIELLRKHPILWLPYLGAHLLASALMWLRIFVSRRIIGWCPTVHSVLGAAYPNCGSETWGFKLTLIHLLRAGFEYADHCIFTIELVAIAAITGAILRGQRPSIETVTGSFSRSPGRMLMYSLKIWFLSLLLVALLYAPAYVETFSTHIRSRWASHAFTTAQSMLSLVCYVWIMVTLAFALLRPANAGAVTASEKWQGRTFCILAGVAAYATQSLLNLLVQFVPAFGSNAVRPIVLSILSPVFSFPNLLADIALVLLASCEDWRSVEIGSVLNFRDWLRGLMPLHFGEGEEP